MEYPMTQDFFPIHTLDTVRPDLKENLETVKKNNGGYIPNLIGLLANSPTALTVSGINRRSSLNPTEREVVQITAAVANGCGFCVAGHTAISIKQVKMPDLILQALRQGTPIETDAKLDALARFTLAVIHEKGKVGNQLLQEFFQEGYTDENALDVVLGVSLATLCNYANNLINTPINPELQAYAL
ncbi:TPA: carboxymuconolactone decarboxylase family protein [Streptococcus suis]|nr:carboxymuconolactone decarboxylase family protein [Streptococcus suis]HEM2781515.1 carboxymuconolactone decarboxylase family protein [Streptococcus suis]